MKNGLKKGGQLKKCVEIKKSEKKRETGVREKKGKRVNMQENVGKGWKREKKEWERKEGRVGGNRITAFSTRRFSTTVRNSAKMPLFTKRVQKLFFNRTLAFFLKKKVKLNMERVLINEFFLVRRTPVRVLP